MSARWNVKALISSATLGLSVVTFGQIATPALARDAKVVRHDDVHSIDEGRGPVVIVLPGWPLGSATWSNTAAHLVERGFRVIRIDQRGFGASSALPGPYSYDQFAADLDHVLRAKHLTHVTLVGHSMGGAVAAHYAAGPGRDIVDNLVLVAAAGPAMVEGPGHSGGVPRTVFDGIVTGVSTNRSDFLDGFAAAFFATAQSADSLETFKGQALEASPEATLDAITAVSRSDLTPELARIRARTVIVHGTADKLVPYSQAAIWSSAISGSRIETFRDAGHGLYLEQAPRLESIIADLATAR